MSHLGVALLVVTCLGAACASTAPAAPRATPGAIPHGAAIPEIPARDDDDLREVVFRHLFDHNLSGQQKKVATFCLQIEGQGDPSPDLLGRFAGNTPAVKPASLCVLKHPHAHGTAADDTGAPALIFRIDAIRRNGPDAAVVEGGYFEAGLSASGNAYDLARENGHWVVKRDTLRWIA